jgi:hypothetical protein
VWLGQDRARVAADHLLRAAEVLGVSAETLARPLPCLGPEERRLTAALIWDRLYPDLVDLASAAGPGEHAAVARLVQAQGLFATAKMLGDRVWEEFPLLMRHIQPARRRGVAALHEWHRLRIAG